MDSNDIPPIASPPPPYNQPPPVMSSPAPVRPRKSRGWMIVALVLLMLLAFSVLGNFTQWLGHVIPMKGSHTHSNAAWQFDESMVEDNDSENKIAVVDVSGIITSRMGEQGGMTMVERIKEELKLAQEDDKVKAVLLKVDSPGGEVLASDEIYTLIKDFQNGK